MNRSVKTKYITIIWVALMSIPMLDSSVKLVRLDHCKLLQLIFLFIWVGSRKAARKSGYTFLWSWMVENFDDGMCNRFFTIWSYIKFHNHRDEMSRPFEWLKSSSKADGVSINHIMHYAIIVRDSLKPHLQREIWFRIK